MSPTEGSDSFLFSLEGYKGGEFQVCGTGQHRSWGWGAVVRDAWLTAGERRLLIKAREAPTRIHQLLLTDDKAFDPTKP